MNSLMAFVSIFSKSRVICFCFEEVELEAGGFVVVLVNGDGSFVFGEGTCDGSISAVVSAVGVVYIALFIVWK